MKESATLDLLYMLTRKARARICERVCHDACHCAYVYVREYTLDPTKFEWADYDAVEPIWKRAHTLLVMERSGTVVSAR